MNPEIEISVVIPTHNRVTLLKKLLHSIEKSNIPVSIKKIIIIENGSHVSEELVNSFQESLPIDYQYFERGNKSLALNYTLEGIPENHFVLFFDDDIEVSPNVFTLYESAVRRIGKGHYFGGPTGVNYEEAPLSELIKYMPDSNRGISQELKEAGTSTDETFLGFNWGAFREDLMKISGFSELYGPGASSGARGQETDAQLRLLDIGVKPIYVPDALVHHWVPKHHLTKEWVMDRLYKSAMRRGKIEGTFIKKIYWVMMLFRYKLLSVFSDKLELDYLNNVYSGYLEGSKLKNNKSNHSLGIMVVLFVLLFLGSCTIPKEVASIYDYGIKDSVPVNHKKAQVFFDENEIIEIPSDMLFVVNGDLVLKGKKTLIINGTLKGIQANERIITDGDVRIIGKGNLVRFAVEVRGGTFSMSDVSIAKTGRTAAILINNKDKVVEDFKVSGVNIKDCAFGILRQGKGGQLPVRYGLIENCSISDCRGDGIEWNIGNQDGEFEILNNRLNNINSDLRGPISEEWGIGIGVAGKGYSDDFSNCVKNFRIEGNVIENVRHGIHVEAGRDFTIKNNKVVTNSKVSLRSQKLLSLVGIAVYGSKNYVIEQNEILAKKGRAMENQFGSLPKIWYLASPTNYKVIGNKIEGGVMNWCSGDGNEVLVEGNTIKGKLLHRGAAKHLLKNNTILSNGDKLGLEIDFFGTKDSRAKYNAKSDFLILDVNNKVTDSKGKESKLIKSKNKIKIYQNLSDYNNNRRR